MLAGLRRLAQHLASFVAVERPRKAKIRPTNSQVALSAWELACHILPTMVFAAQRFFSSSVGARYRPSQTALSGTQGARLLTLPPTGGMAGYVGKNHRGMSCGWTICLAPGHRAVARRGVLTQWTWQCTPPPPGPNTTGYGVIAQAALEQQLPKPTPPTQTR